MGEAAVKEPSMEDILSSIRKIISEEGVVPEAQPVVQNEAASTVAHSTASQGVAETSEKSVNKMSEMLEQVRASEPTITEPVVSSNSSGVDAAKIASALSNMVEQPQKYEVEALSDELEDTSLNAEPSKIVEDVSSSHEAIEVQETSLSLASIAESVTEQVEAPVAFTSASIVPEAVQETSEATHVKMAEAKPAPHVETPVLSSAVETMVEEEIAFKGALMSPSSNGEVSNAFDRLKRSAMDDIDAKTESILRPMLREWLDENLPNMVERLVREEIERVARGV